MREISDIEACVDAIVAKVGKRIRLGTPLGLGKPVALLNAIYRRAKKDPSIDLHILTALTLERPKGKSELEKRFLGPFVERVFGDYPDLDYELDRVAGELPKNVRVIEFYFYAGKYLGNPVAQRDYISSNYTHVARDLLDRGINVIAQEICRGTIDGEPMLSLSCNPDLSIELMEALRRQGEPWLMIGAVNPELPFMHGDAAQHASAFDLVLDHPSCKHKLFGTPKTSIADDELMIGLYASTLIRDGGTLQIGIGSIGDALVYALKLRHEHNALYRQVLAELSVIERFGGVIERIGGLAPFAHGLFASSEMLVDGFMHLIEAGIVKRKVSGALAHAGFFLGPESFYQWLRDLPEERRREIRMLAIRRTNELHGHEITDRVQRVDARFVNTAMMVTLSGAIVSDGLESGQVVSGVGGQYNFVAMAHALEGARSIVQVRSTRRAQGEVASGVVYSYGHTTIPRHLRDVIVTDHGIALLRGKTDEEIADALLRVTDSRFQHDLQTRAIEEGKLPVDYALPDAHAQNDPERYESVLASYRKQGHFPRFPFGTDLTEQEIVLGRALTALKAKIESRAGTLEALAEAVVDGAVRDDVRPYLERMGLAEPSTLRETLYQRLLTAELRQVL